MTDNSKKFLEFMSTQDKETQDKICKMEKEELFSYASEQGITLSDADIEKPDEEGEVSLDEADAVAGGEVCLCLWVGGGSSDDDTKPCACVFGGGGPSENGDPCSCAILGNGDADR